MRHQSVSAGSQIGLVEAREGVDDDSSAGGPLSQGDRGSAHLLAEDRRDLALDCPSVALRSAEAPAILLTPERTERPVVALRSTIICAALAWALVTCTRLVTAR